MKYKVLPLIALAMLAATSCINNQKASQWSITGFERSEMNPIIVPDTTMKFLCPMHNDSVAWMESDVFNPAATVKGDEIVVLFRAEDNSATGIGSRTSRLGYAASADGEHFTILPEPVCFPAEDSQKENEWPGGCEDPRIAMTDDGTYVMLYTQWNRKVPRLAVATSKDLLTWEKHGPAFAQAYDGKFADIPTKSASIVTRIDDQGRQVIAPINGKYYMYWGEQAVNVATSDDLINWTPATDENGDLEFVITPRPGKFDSALTECGPPAVLTDKGIILMYNGKNATDETGSPDHTPGAYSGGQALFDAKDPSRLLMQLDEPFFRPEADFEKSGQYPAGTVFLEGLVYFKGKWYLYYGCADSRVSVAIAPAL